MYYIIIYRVTSKLNDHGSWPTLFKAEHLTSRRLCVTIRDLSENFIETNPEISAEISRIAAIQL